MSTSISKRLTGTSRPAATTSGWGERTPPGVKRGSTPGLTTEMFSSGRRSISTISCFDEDDRVMMRLRRYTGGASVNSSISPRRARISGFSTMRHISACTWWRNTTRGHRAQAGEKKGIPFQTSTSASR